MFRCARVVYAWLASVHASLRVSGGSVATQAHFALTDERAHCMTTTAALAPLDLEEGAAYDAVLAEIK